MDPSVRIDWQGSEAHWLLNPRAPQLEREWAPHANKKVSSNLIWLRTSGSTSRHWRWVGLERQAILTSAKAVNERLQVMADDVWLKILPSFHIGGLAILARAHLSGNRVIEHPEWDVSKFVQIVENEKITLVSLVPTQVFDLVARQKPAPASLRAVVVGGGALSEQLYGEARKLGWPVLPSFGMTECASQIATATLSSLTQKASPGLVTLPHLQVRVDDEGILSVAGPSLFSLYCEVDPDTGESRVHDPKVQGWLKTEDFCQLMNDEIRPLGRRSSVVKVGGELVNFDELNRIWRELGRSLGERSVLLPVPCSRLGHRPVLILERGVSTKVVETTLVRLSERVPPFSLPREIYNVSTLPRSALGKILIPQLLSSMGFE